MKYKYQLILKTRFSLHNINQQSLVVCLLINEFIDIILCMTYDVLLINYIIICKLYCSNIKYLLKVENIQVKPKDFIKLKKLISGFLILDFFD